MPAKKVVAKCPYDACPMTRFAKCNATHGYTIELHGCVYCGFNCVAAVAVDAAGDTRPVAWCNRDPESGMYTARERGTNPEGWLDLVFAMLPNPKQREQQTRSEQNQQRNST